MGSADADSSKFDPLDPDAQLMHEMGALAPDPLEWVRFSFRWGHDDLAGFEGPDKWATEFLQILGEEIQERGFDRTRSVDPIWMAVGSGRGVGKTALAAWLILFLMSTRPLCRGKVTASTSTQLASITLPELAKWQQRCIVGHWFRLYTSSNSMRLVHQNPLHRELWRTEFHTSKKEHAEAFSGQHAVDSSSFYLFDESSGVPDVIYDFAEGGQTDGEPFWFLFGNRTRSVGRFHACWGARARRWLTFTVDARDVKISNKRLIQEWIEDYGEDSDFVRVHVRGLPPKAATMQFIAEEIVLDAQKREIHLSGHEPLIMGVDVARHGGDKSVIRYRKGRHADTIPPFKQEYTDNLIDFADYIARQIKSLGVDLCVVDGGGLGAGVVDSLHATHKLHRVVKEVNFGWASSDRRYFNKRSQLWGNLREWLKTARIDSDSELQADLLAQEAFTDDRTRTIRLVGKKTMRDLGQKSTDDGDALALTTAFELPDKVEDAGGSHQVGAKSRKPWHPFDRLEAA